MKKIYIVFIILSALFYAANTFGQTWSVQTSPTTTPLNSVSFTDANNGTAVGSNKGDNIIIRTTNGGTTWILQTTNTNGLNGVSFTDANNGTVVGNGGTILRTTNGGTNWIDQSILIPGWLEGVSFTDANNGTAVGFNGGNNTGAIVRTTNGGTNWTTQTSGSGSQLSSVSFTDANNGTAVGDGGTILRTTNGGTNWITQISGTSNQLLSVSFTDSNNGTAVGLGTTVLRTTNGGTNWTSQFIEGGYDFTGVSFTDVNNGTAISVDGTILRTTNGGTNWTVQTSLTGKTLYGVSFTDANNGTVVGYDENGNGLILRTTDASLPVELILFTAQINGRSILLNWKTATEVNNYGFDVERCQISNVKSETWEKIGFVKGHGNSNSTKTYSFTDKNQSAGTVDYRLKQIDISGNYEYSKIVEVSVDVPVNFALRQNFPNPFNPTTIINYELPMNSHVILKVYDVLGKEVATLVNTTQNAGRYSLNFATSQYGMSSGIYFYRLDAGNYIEMKKMVVLK